MTTTNQRFKTILTKLLDKSRIGKVRWEILHQGEPIAGFKVSVTDPAATIVVERFAPSVEPDFFKAELLVNGNAVSELLAEDGGDVVEYELLSEVWQDAHRCVFGWDSALDKLESLLQSEGTVGTPMKAPAGIGAPQI